MLFEDRYGHEVYFPCGMEWFDREYWNFEREWHGDAVARQYLEGIWTDASQGEVRLRPDPRHPWRVQKGVEYEIARDMEWDLVISSLPHNDEGMYRFSQEVGAKFGVQVGNHIQQSRWDLASFVLSSSTLPGFGPEHIGQRFMFAGTPTVMYHQEFDTEVFRHEWPPAEPRSVASFVNCFAEMREPYAQFAALSRRHPDFDWKCYGSYGSATPDELAAGDISSVPDVADAMRASRVIWHAKAWSDGFGHVIHNAFAVGRPVVGYKRYYADKIAAPLMVEGVTFFDMEKPEAEVIDTLTRLRDDDDLHRTMSINAAARFREVVDFDGEAETIMAMLEDVL
jgi:hypothetical protein